MAMETTAKPPGTSSLNGVLHSAHLSREKALDVDLQPTFSTKCCKVDVSPGWQPGVQCSAPEG